VLAFPAENVTLEILLPKVLGPVPELYAIGQRDLYDEQAELQFSLVAGAIAS
jgi:hypothetical protein